MRLTLYEATHQPNLKLGQTTTPETQGPTLYEKCVGSLTSPSNQYREDAGDRAYDLSSFSELLEWINPKAFSTTILFVLTKDKLIS